MAAQKNQKKSKKESEKEINTNNPKLNQSGHKPGVWKIIAIVFIIIFALFIIGGLIRAYHFRSSFVKPTQEQINTATKIASEKLASTGASLSDYKIKTTDRMLKPLGNKDKNKDENLVLQVLFYNNSTTHAYLVDVTSGQVLLHSETETFGNFANPGMPHPSDKFELIGGPFPGPFESKEDVNGCNR